MGFLYKFRKTLLVSYEVCVLRVLKQYLRRRTAILSRCMLPWLCMQSGCVVFFVAVVVRANQAALDPWLHRTVVAGLALSLLVTHVLK